MCGEGEGPYPDLLCVITGKGPLKEFYRVTIFPFQEKRKFLSN
jgi:hypothetical protein